MGYQVCVKEEATQTRKRHCNGKQCKGPPGCKSDICEKENENDPEEWGICQECKINGNKGCNNRQSSACEKPSNGGLNQCRGCLNPTECSHIPGYTACNMAANPPQCAKCDPASDKGCKDNDVDKYCVNDVGPIVGVDTKCVECKTSAHCHDATRSQCSLGPGPAQNTCVPCQGPPDCNHIPGKRVCVHGRCVACRADADCPDESPTIDAAYRFCKNDNTCGYQAFV